MLLEFDIDSTWNDNNEFEIWTKDVKINGFGNEMQSENERSYMMKKILNAPGDVVEQMVQGLVKSHGDIVEQLENTLVVHRKEKQQGKVALVSGGGSGHEPAHAGFVGKGMLSAAVCGQVFTSPTPDQIYEAIKGVDQGEGVLLIVKNYSGDVMNFDIAKDMADMEEIQVGIVLVDDDIAVEDSTYTQGKRGVAGTIFVHKIIGAAAEKGLSLIELENLGKKVVSNTKTIGVALSGATVPEVGKPGFVLGDDEIEFGVGIHGEPGYKKEKMKMSVEIADEMVQKLKDAFSWSEQEKYAVLVNGLGGTPLMEQYVFMNDVLNALDKEKLDVVFTKVGNYMTAIEMCGVSLTLLKIESDEWLENLNDEANTISWK